MKPKIVEVIGPPGVGKSTVYYALCDSWTPNAPWTHQDALLASPKPAVGQFVAWLEHTCRTLLRRPKPKSIPVEYGLRFSDAHKDLATFCWEHLAGSDMPLNREIGNRFRSSYFLFSDFCRYQAILEYSNGTPCIMEEGFLQKSFLLHNDQHALHHTLATYLSLIPLPQAVLLLDTPDIPLITERLANRDKVIASHLNADEATLQKETEKWRALLLASVAKLEQRGVQVYRLDAARPVSANVALAQEFLSNLN